jgi:phosphatidylinositol alpha-1,6-mannosyltransferase
MGALDRLGAIAWNCVQLVRHAGGADLVHFAVEPYAVSSLPFSLPPSCISVHGTYAVCPFEAGRLTHLLYTGSLQRARAVICVSRFTRAALLGKLHLDNVAVIPNGHDMLPAWDASSPTGPAAGDKLIMDGGPVILGVGALKPRKGYHVALRAVARLRERFPDLRYYLVGDDSDHKYVARLRADISELGLEQRAVITGTVSERRLRAFYSQADLFLLTPVNIDQHFEGFGIAYLEAGVFGKPVVGSAGCGAEDAIEHGVTGFLAPQNDESAVAERAGAILDDQALAGRLGEAGRARAQTQTWAAVARKYIELYEHTLRR